MQMENVLDLRRSYDNVMQFSDAENQVIGTVKIVNRRRWWAPWSKRKVVAFEGNVEKSAKLLFEMWGEATFGI